MSRDIIQLKMSEPGVLLVTHEASGESVAICDAPAVNGPLTLDRVWDALVTLNVLVADRASGDTAPHSPRMTTPQFVERMVQTEAIISRIEREREG